MTVTRPSLVDAVVAQLQREIVGGTYPPGTQLPAERELAAELGVTRTSLAHALARLRELGLVETKHGAGTVVRDYERLGGLEVLPVIVASGAPGWMGEIFEVRRELGALIAAKAARKATAKQRDRLADAVDAIRTAATPDEAQLAECEVHRLLAAATGNRVYGLAVNAVLAAYLQVRQLLQEPFRDPEAAADRIAPVVDAVVAGDADAAQARADSYLQTTGRLMIGG